MPHASSEQSQVLRPLLGIGGTPGLNRCQPRLHPWSQQADHTKIGPGSGMKTLGSVRDLRVGRPHFW